ncbi:SRPBCC family protein [Pseudoalteromonas sp.]|uniref:SRPBCC family protein n=1 Tax=Pseudoalteromonas sp. TaxID=53249 RepID=UPI003563E5E2
MISITVTQKIAATPRQLSHCLLEHAQLKRFFNAKFTLIKAENNGERVGGKGAIRQVTTLGYTFNEQITAANDKQISYQIMGNKPVAAHRGDIYFQPLNTTPSSTEVRYHIRCKAPWFLPSFMVSLFIKKDITHALQKLAANFNQGE